MDSNAAKTLADLAVVAESLSRAWHALAYDGPQGASWRPDGPIRAIHNLRDWAECDACAPDREAIAAALRALPMEEPRLLGTIVRWAVGDALSFAVRMDTDTDCWQKPGSDAWYSWGEILEKARGGRIEVIWLPDDGAPQRSAEGV